MPGIGSLKALVEQKAAGAEHLSSWRKQTNVITAAGFWQDLSMSAGNPSPNYYASAPLISAALAQSTDGGIRHGGNVYPATKYLRQICAYTVGAGSVPLPMILCDYLLYYPVIDESVVGDPQLMTNSVTIPRYTTGEGVQMMAVVTAPHTAAGPTFNVSYTNSQGVSGRTSRTVTMNGQFVNGTILTTAPATAGCIGPFIPLQQGDTGVRSVESVTILTLGEVGLFTLVLIKPLANLFLRGIDAPVDRDFLLESGGQLPIIKDDAYLNFLAYPAGSLTGTTIFGLTTVTWST